MWHRSEPLSLQSNRTNARVFLNRCSCRMDPNFQTTVLNKQPLMSPLPRLFAGQPRYSVGAVWQRLERSMPNLLQPNPPLLLILSECWELPYNWVGKLITLYLYDTRVLEGSYDDWVGRRLKTGIGALYFLLVTKACIDWLATLLSLPSSLALWSPE